MRSTLFTLLFVVSILPCFVPPSFAEANYFMRYERRDSPLYSTLPQELLEKATLTEIPHNKNINNSNKQHYRLDKELVRHALLTYRIILRDEWVFLNHINSITNEGWLILENGDKLKWILKSSGVGQLIYPDGGAIHLAKSPSERYREHDKYEYLHTPWE